MSLPSHEGNIKRIVLPSGKLIEVVYFPAEEPAPEQRSAGEPPAPAPEQRITELHVCPECACELVYPTEWEEAGPKHWTVCLHCPNCDWSDSGKFEQGLVDEFDEELDRGSDTLICALKRLTEANMSSELACFVAALEANAILPMDF